MEECIFCKIAGEKLTSNRIYENDNFFSVLDINQEIKGHSLIISKKHFKNLLDMPSTLGPELLDCVKNTALRIMKQEKAGGFNVAVNTFPCAGQIIDHMHVHILPRKENDGLKFDLREK